MPLMRRYAKMSLRQPIVLLQPGVRTRDSRGQWRTSAPQRQEGYFCNWRPRTTNERLTSGVDVVRTLGTAVMRKTSIFDNTEGDWKAEIDGAEYDVVGTIETLERGKYVRLTLERVGD